MENTSHTSPESHGPESHGPEFHALDMATLKAVQHNHAQRLLDMAEALLQKFEAIDLPKDAVGIDRASKALLTLHKTLGALHTHAHGLAYEAAAKVVHDEMDGKPPVEPAQTLEMVKIYKAAQALRLEAMALRRAANGQGEGEATHAKPTPPRHHWP